MSSLHTRRVAIALALLAALALPLVASSFMLFQLSMVLVYAIAILGLDLLTGVNGQFSLGHSAFFAIGAYVAAFLMDRVGLDYGWALPAAGALCFVVGFLFGLPALRLEGAYLALATFALALAMPPLLKLSLLEPWLGGVQGISVLKPEAPAWLSKWVVLNADQWLYCVVLGVALPLFAAAANIVGSRSGRALMAIRDHSIAASAMGIPTALYKALAFGLSAFYTGVAGALATLVVQFVAPESYTLLFSIALLVGLVVGGAGSIWGAVVGGLFILFVPNLAEQVSKSLAGAIYALMLLAAIYLLPTGVAGGARALVASLSRSRRPTTKQET